MKKIFIIFALLTQIISYAQNSELDEVVYLKNGSIIRGIIIEQVPNKGIKIKTKDENIFYYSYDEIEKITKEPKLVSKSSKGKKSTDYSKNYEESENLTRNILTLGYGVGFTFRQSTSYYETYSGYNSNIIGPISVNFEKRLKKISIGGSLNYSKFKSSWSMYTNTQGKQIIQVFNMNTSQALGRISYHFLPLESKFDPYVGGGFGYTHISYSDSFSRAKIGGPFGYSFCIGSRFFPKEHVGGFLELGLGLIAINCGLAFMF